MVPVVWEMEVRVEEKEVVEVRVRRWISRCIIKMFSAFVNVTVTQALGKTLEVRKNCKQ